MHTISPFKMKWPFQNLNNPPPSIKSPSFPRPLIFFSCYPIPRLCCFCQSPRRLSIENSICHTMYARLVAAYGRYTVGKSLWSNSRYYVCVSASCHTRVVLSQHLGATEVFQITFKGRVSTRNFEGSIEVSLPTSSQVYRLV